MSAAQRDSGIMQMSFGWISGLVLGGLAAAAAHNAPGTARGLAVGSGITVGAVLGVRLFRVTGHWQLARSVAWPLVGAGVVALPLTLTGPCSQRGNDACFWMVLMVPLLAAGGASIAEDLAPH